MYYYHIFNLNMDKWVSINGIQWCDIELYDIHRYFASSRLVNGPSGFGASQKEFLFNKFIQNMKCNYGNNIYYAKFIQFCLFVRLSTQENVSIILSSSHLYMNIYLSLSVTIFNIIGKHLQ